MHLIFPPKLQPHLKLDCCILHGWEYFVAYLKVAFSRKGLWKYTLLRFFIIFSSNFFDWLDLNSNFYPQPITKSVKKIRGKNDKKSEKCIFP